MNFSPTEQETFTLRPGDVLVTEGCGSLPEVGASARWDGEMDGPICFQNTLLRLRAHADRTEPEFVYQWARWAYESGAFAEIASGTNIFHIGATRAAEMSIPLPPVDDQPGLVAPLASCDLAVESGERYVEDLSILRRSFVRATLAGDLAAPNADDRLAALEPSRP